MLSPIAMNSMSDGTESNGEADGEYAPQENLDTSLGRETMLHLLQSRQRALRASLEGSLSSLGALQSNQGGRNIDMMQSLQGSQGGMDYGHGGSLLQNDNESEFHNDGSMGFQGGFSEDFNQMNPTGMANSSNQQFLGGFGEQGQVRGMSNSGDGNIEDELLRLLLARRQRLRSTAASLGQTINPPSILRPSESELALDSGNISSLTDDLLRTYTRNRAGDLGSSLQENMFQSPSLAAQGNMQMDQHHLFSSGASHRSSSLPMSRFQHGDLHRSASLPTRNSQDMRFPQDRLDDTIGVLDLIDSPERIEPMPMSVSDIMMRDHLQMREQQSFINSDEGKRQFLKARRAASSASINFGQLEGFDFGPAGGSMLQESPPRKRKKSSPRKKPADMPRRPLSAYNLFFSEEREVILRELSEEKDVSSGDQTPTETSTTLTETSTEVKSDPSSEEDDDGDKKLSASSIVESASSIVESGSGDLEDDDSPSKVKIKALLRPLIPSQKQRRPHRKTHGKISFQSLARLVGERWRNLPDERRKYYQELAKEDTKRQKVAMDEYYRKQEAAKGKKIATGDGTVKGESISNQEESTEDTKPTPVEGTMTDAVENSTGEEGKSTEEAGKSIGEVVEEVVEEAGKAIQDEGRPVEEAGSKEEIEFLKAEEKMTEEEGKKIEEGGALDGALNVAAV